MLEIKKNNIDANANQLNNNIDESYQKSESNHSVTFIFDEENENLPKNSF